MWLDDLKVLESGKAERYCSNTIHSTATPSGPHKVTKTNLSVTGASGQNTMILILHPLGFVRSFVGSIIVQMRGAHPKNSFIL